MLKRWWIWVVVVVLAIGPAALAVDKSPRRSDREERRGSRKKPAEAPAEAPREESQIVQTAGDDEPNPLTEVLEFAEKSRAAMKEVQDYTAVFSKTELVGNRLVKQSMEMKLRHEPFSVYFKFLTGDKAGREVIFVEGSYNNRLVVHEVAGLGALAGTMQLKLSDDKVKAENRYPITRVGIANMLDTAISIWKTEQQLPAADMDVKFFPEAKLKERTADAKLRELPCRAIEVTHKVQRRELKFHKSQVYFDKETNLPVHAQRFGWPRRPGDKPPLLEEYTYSNLKLNVGLTDADFDFKNPKYGF